MNDLEFYPMDHGDPYNGDWVLLLDGFGRYNPCRWTKDAVCRFITRSGKAILDSEAGGWIPIAYWRPAETQPDRQDILSLFSGEVNFGTIGAMKFPWQPMPIAPPSAKPAPESPLAKISDAELLAELQRRMGAK